MKNAGRDLRCPKCDAGSGDDWCQCKGACPMPGSPYHHPAALFLRPQGSRTVTWTCRLVEQNDSLVSIDLACDDDGVLARVDLRRDANGVAIAQVSFESAHARRAWAACLRTVADVLAVMVERADFPAEVRSRPIDLRDPVVGPLTYAAGDAHLELTGADAWLALAAAFGESYVKTLPTEAILGHGLFDR
jgi:hypothetical protein